MTFDSSENSPLTLGACGYPQDFIATLDMFAKQAASGGHLAGLLIVSIDNLAMIVSGYGVSVAENVMEDIRELIDMQAGAASVVTRTQRDQFGILIPKTTSADLEALAAQLRSDVREASSQLRYGDVHCVASVAHHVLPFNDASTEEILGRTLVALAHQGTGHCSDTHAAQSREQMGLANFLGQAIQHKRIRLAYQPVIASKTGAVSHYEALLRLHSDDGKISSAGALIPVAERMGLIADIDRLTLEMVVKELRHDPNVVLALNVSNLTTHDSVWYKHLRTLIDETPAIAPRLIVELTETAIHRDLKLSAMFCAELQAMGVMVALDDFGAGYTSFSQLKSLEIDMIKIDGVFVRDLTDNADSRFFVKTLLDFTHGFGLKAVAEFVENGEVAKLLMELGVDYLQGYYFGKPMNFRGWLKES
ncbi:MAG: GGDEF domain-containing protein [Alphaproteobacteria bacterium]|nr:GGDEF domain-containing protein [Alphaproteobacteria bacterium]